MATVESKKRGQVTPMKISSVGVGVVVSCNAWLADFFAVEEPGVGIISAHRTAAEAEAAR